MSLDRIASAFFTATDEDALRIRVRSTGIHSTTLNFENSIFTFVDTGGERAERKKWLTCFRKDAPIVFVVDSSGWDRVLYEDENANRMDEDLREY